MTRLLIVLFHLTILLPLSAHSQTKEQSTIFVGGTGAATGAMKILGRQFEQEMPDTRVKVFPSLGSGGGVRALLAGKLQMAFTSRPLKTQEESEGLVAHAVIKTPFVFVTQSDIDVSNLSLEEIAEIYRSKRTHWPDGQLIRPVLRPEYDADSKIVMEMAPTLKDALKLAHSHSGKNVAATDFDSANELERIEGAFGTTTTLLIKSEKRDLNILSLDGVEPSPENYRSGRYPHGKTIFAILPANPSARAKAFLTFLKSDVAHKLIRSLDAIPADSL